MSGYNLPGNALVPRPREIILSRTEPVPEHRRLADQANGGLSASARRALVARSICIGGPHPT
jgi:hypothetical protein